MPRLAMIVARGVRRLNQIPVLRPVLAVAQRLQLTLILWVLRQRKETRALILRRGAALEDAYPGDSDYDITCVFDCDDGSLRETVLCFGALHRRLKILCPALGETKLIHAKDFPAHLRYRYPEYEASQQVRVLYARPDFRLPRVAPTRTSIYDRAVEILRHRLWAFVFLEGNDANPGKKVFARPVLKNIQKVQWLDRLANEPDVPELSYLSINRTERIYRTHRQLVRSIDTCVSSLIHSHERGIRQDRDSLDLTVHGQCQFPPANELQRLRGFLTPLIEEFGVDLESVTLSNLRLYQFEKQILIRLRRGTASGEEKLFRGLRRCARQIQAERFAFLSGYPLAVDQGAWRFLMSADQLGRAFFKLGHYDFVAERVCSAGTGTLRVSRDTLLTNLANAVALTTTEARDPTEAPYMMDLVLGHLIPYTTALREGILYASFEALEQKSLSGARFSHRQAELIERYHQGDRAFFDRLTPEKLWRILDGFIVEQIEAAREILNSTSPLTLLDTYRNAKG